MNRRSLIGLIPFTVAVMKASASMDVIHAFDGRLRDTLQSAIREFDPNGGDFGRGPQIRKSQLAGVAIILEGMGFKPYVFDAPDEFGQAFPLYGCSGGLTAMAQRVWTREREGKFECIPFEYCNLPGADWVMPREYKPIDFLPLKGAK